MSLSTLNIQIAKSVLLHLMKELQLVWFLCKSVTEIGSGKLCSVELILTDQFVICDKSKARWAVGASGNGES